MRQPPSTSPLRLAPEWEQWLVDNLLGGVEPRELYEQLASQGVSLERAQAETHAILTSPAYRAAARYGQRIKRLELGATLLRQLERDAGLAQTVERRPKLSTEDFFRSYFTPNVPVIVPQMVAHWDAVGRWTPAYLREHFGHATIEMMGDREADPWCDLHSERHRQQISMAAFVERVEQASDETNDFYLVARNRNIDREPLCRLLDDIEVDPTLFDPEKRETYYSFWFGPQGTVTPLHHDTTNIFFFQIYGQKRVRMISPRETALLGELRGFYSLFNCDDLELERPALYQKLAIKEVILEPGDGLFIPVGWWHQVRSLSVSINLSLLNFRRPNQFSWYAPGRV